MDMTNDELKRARLAFIERELARLAALSPIERAEIDRSLAKAHQARESAALTAKVLGR